MAGPPPDVGGQRYAVGQTPVGVPTWAWARAIRSRPMFHEVQLSSVDVEVPVRAQAAISLRQEGFTGNITMVGEEQDLPYERPPLSKEYFAGEAALKAGGAHNTMNQFAA